MASSWVVVTGGGTGIGRALVHHFSRSHNVLTVGRRRPLLLETKQSAPVPASVVVVTCDIGCRAGREALTCALPTDARIELLIHNAAIGDPGNLRDLDIAHFEEALRVNVVAPLALSQSLLASLKRANGRILHLGTSVAFHPQLGTTTYGVSKMAFHRLYQQLNAEGIVPVGSISPGMVDTEGVRDHVAKARALALPHVRYFDEAFDKQWTTAVPELMQFVDEVVALDAHEFSRREWRFSEWRKQRAKGVGHAVAQSMTYGEWALGKPPSRATLAIGACVALVAAFASGVAVGSRTAVRAASGA